MLRRLWLPIGICLLTGCTVNVDGAPIREMLPELQAQLAANRQGAAGLVSGSPAPGASPAAGTCANGATPASGTLVGGFTLGDYNGVALPGSFGAYQAEQDVTDRITKFAQDTSPKGTAVWADFQCLFPQAVGIWAGKAHGTTPAPTVSVAPPHADAAPPPAAAASTQPDCPADIDPANGTTVGSFALGDYNGVTLPASFAVYQSEQDVTNRIGAFAADTSATGINTWAKFQCFYGPAVAVWRSKQAADTGSGG